MDSAHLATNAQRTATRHTHAGWVFEAVHALSAGDVQTAICRCQDVLVSDPGHVGALEILAEALWTVGDEEMVLEIVDRLVSINPYEPGYFQLRANVYARQRKFTQAVREFRRAGCEEEAAQWQADADRIHDACLQDDVVFRAGYRQLHRPSLLPALAIALNEPTHSLSRA